MTPVLTRAELLRMKKKEVLNKLGYTNIKDYYRSTSETGKISRKKLVKLAVLQGVS